MRGGFCSRLCWIPDLILVSLVDAHTQTEIVDKANYYHARGHLLKEIELEDTIVGKHENAARLRTATG